MWSNCNCVILFILLFYSVCFLLLGKINWTKLKTLKTWSIINYKLRQYHILLLFCKLIHWERSTSSKFVDLRTSNPVPVMSGIFFKVRDCSWTWWLNNEDMPTSKTNGYVERYLKYNIVDTWTNMYCTHDTDVHFFCGQIKRVLNISRPSQQS